MFFSLSDSDLSDDEEYNSKQLYSIVVHGENDSTSQLRPITLQILEAPGRMFKVVCKDVKTFNCGIYTKRRHANQALIHCMKLAMKNSLAYMDCQVCHRKIYHPLTCCTCGVYIMAGKTWNIHTPDDKKLI